VLTHLAAYDSGTHQTERKIYITTTGEEVRQPTFIALQGEIVREIDRLATQQLPSYRAVLREQGLVHRVRRADLANLHILPKPLARAVGVVLGM
jgi:hypothetical protein